VEEQLVEANAEIQRLREVEERLKRSEQENTKKADEVLQNLRGLATEVEDKRKRDQESRFRGQDSKFRRVTSWLPNFVAGVAHSVARATCSRNP
jgi:hypothetical protein